MNGERVCLNIVIVGWGVIFIVCGIWGIISTASVWKYDSSTNCTVVSRGIVAEQCLVCVKLHRFHPEHHCDYEPYMCISTFKYTVAHQTFTTKNKGHICVKSKGQCDKIFKIGKSQKCWYSSKEPALSTLSNPIRGVVYFWMAIVFVLFGIGCCLYFSRKISNIW